MINSIREDPQYRFAFSNFRTKPSVLKRKLGAEFAKKEWNVSSAGFGEDLTSSFEKRHNRKVLKYKTETLPKNILATDSKQLPNPSKTQFLPFHSTDTEIREKSPRNLKRSIEENESKSDNPFCSKRTGSVFLEVQNIQSTFKRKNLNVELKPLVELPSEFSKKFKAEILCHDPRQKGKPEIPVTNCAIAYVKPYCKPSFDFVGNRNVNANKYTQLGNIQSNVRSARSTVNFKSSVKVLSDFQIKTDLTLKSVDNVQKTPSPVLTENTFEDADFIIKKLTENNASCFQIKSDFASQQINNVQNILSFTDNNLSNVCETSKKFPEKAGFCQKIKEADSQLNSNSLANEKSSKVLEFGKKSKFDLITKRKFTEENVFQSSFREEVSDGKPPPATLSPKSVQNFKSNLLLKRKDELENAPKKIKVDKCNFIVPSDLAPSNVVCKVRKMNVSASTFPRSEKEVFVPTIAQKSSNELATNSEFPPASERNYQPSKLNLDNESSFQGNSSRSEISLLDFSRLLGSKSDGSKGSDWMQLLKPTLTEENDEVDHDEPIKKKIRNILPGGFAEQILKLQRRENSEKVIWNHKINRNKRKAQNDSLCLTINSISHMEEFIIAKASSASEMEPQSFCEEDGSTVDKSSLPSTDVNLSHLKWNQNESKDALNFDVVFILFKRNAFTRLKLKVGDTFKVYQPWQAFHLNSTPHPLILCAYFIDVVSSSCPRITNEDNIHVTGLSEAPTLLKTIAYPETATYGDLLFFKKDELVSFSARIQRIWKKEFKVRDPTTSSAATTYLRYSVLLQIKVGTFHELRILPDAIPNLWYDVMSQGEGKCYRFHNLCVTHRAHLKKDKYLRDILKTLHLKNGSKLEQNFCYQLMFDSSSKCPEEIAEIGFPDYRPVSAQPLLQILKMNTCDRFTCVAKVLLQHKDVFYISDDSLLDSPSLKYIQMNLLMTAEIISSLEGSIVLIKEALVEEGSLLIDNHSQLIPISESSHEYQQLSPADKSKVKNQADVCLKNVIQFLQMFSKVEEIVCIKGRITNVDESAAFTWLQCSFCFQENLIQDTNLVIYCEDCSRIVPSPILNVKLEVVVHCPQLPSAKVNVQLLSTTIKRILQIPEGTYQPQCSVCDVLGKEIGPLYCYVLSCDSTSDNTVFYLSEVHSS